LYCSRVPGLDWKVGTLNFEGCVLVPFVLVGTLLVTI